MPDDRNQSDEGEEAPYKWPSPTPAAGRNPDAAPRSKAKPVDPFATVTFGIDHEHPPGSPEVIAAFKAWEKAHREWQQHRRGPEPPRPNIGIIEYGSPGDDEDDAGQPQPIGFSAPAAAEVQDDYVPVDEARVYVPPVTLPPSVAHKTFEMETVKIDPSLDPRKSVTQPRIRPVNDRKTPPGPTVVINEQLAEGGAPGSPRTVGGRTAKLIDAPPAAAPRPVPADIAARIEDEPSSARTLGGRTARLGQAPSSPPPGAVDNSPWASEPSSGVDDSSLPSSYAPLSHTPVSRIAAFSPFSPTILAVAAGLALVVGGTAGWLALRGDDAPPGGPAATTALTSTVVPPDPTEVAATAAAPPAPTAAPVTTTTASTVPTAAAAATSARTAKPTGKPIRPGAPPTQSTTKPALPGGASPEF
jgi:hypothetical protein